ncbi:MAG: hypothetical protein NTV52_25040 [Acidobacteria bacterium]|jgi:predicted transcriptional regulator|nr:hypothetical protein [Acidobacteriota bacterium]
MASVKEEIHALIDRLPDDATYEDVEYALYVRREIELGLQEVESGQLLTQEEAEARILGWRID